MNIRCENCGQLALETDKVCWHCGRPLPGREIEEPEKVAVNKGWQQTQSLGTIGGYIAVAAIVIIAALLVTQALGQYPKVSANIGDRAPEGWETYSDFRTRYTFFLPQEWTWFEPARRENRSDPPLAYLLENGRYFTTGTNPFGLETDDIEVEFLAVPISDTAAFENEEQLIDALFTTDAFMLIGHSILLNTTVYTDTIQYLLNSDYRILAAELIQEEDRNFLTISTENAVETADDFDFLQCEQQFFLGRRESLLVTVCAKDTSYIRYQRTFTQILTSFRRLYP